MGNVNSGPIHVVGHERAGLARLLPVGVEREVLFPELPVFALLLLIR